MGSRGQSVGLGPGLREAACAKTLAGYSFGYVEP